MFSSYKLIVGVGVGALLLGCSTTSPDATLMDKSSSEVIESTVAVSERVELASPEVLSRIIYADYSADAFSEKLGKEPLALFFHAHWCSTCTALDSDITSSLSSFPDGTTILKANFDTELDLRKTYGVSLQSTLVVFSSDGSVSDTLLGPNVTTLKSAIAKTL